MAKKKNQKKKTKQKVKKVVPTVDIPVAVDISEEVVMELEGSVDNSQIINASKEEQSHESQDDVIETGSDVVDLVSDMINETGASSLVGQVLEELDVPIDSPSVEPIIDAIREDIESPVENPVDEPIIEHLQKEIETDISEPVVAPIIDQVHDSTIQEEQDSIVELVQDSTIQEVQKPVIEQEEQPFIEQTTGSVEQSIEIPIETPIEIPTETPIEIPLSEIIQNNVQDSSPSLTETSHVDIPTDNITDGISADDTFPNSTEILVPTESEPLGKTEEEDEESSFKNLSQVTDQPLISEQQAYKIEQPLDDMITSQVEKSLVESPSEVDSLPLPNVKEESDVNNDTVIDEDVVEEFNKEMNLSDNINEPSIEVKNNNIIMHDQLDEETHDSQFEPEIPPASAGLDTSEPISEPIEVSLRMEDDVYGNRVETPNFTTETNFEDLINETLPNMNNNNEPSLITDPSDDQPAISYNNESNVEFENREMEKLSMNSPEKIITNEAQVPIEFSILNNDSNDIDGSEFFSNLGKADNLENNEIEPATANVGTLNENEGSHVEVIKTPLNAEGKLKISENTTKEPLINDANLSSNELDLSNPDLNKSEISSGGKHFAFLNDDDDFLDDEDLSAAENTANDERITQSGYNEDADINISDNDSLIGSDEDFEFSLQPTKTVIESGIKEKPIVENKYMPISNIILSAPTPNNQKYEPKTKGVQQAVITNSALSGMNTAGIVAPQPFQNTASVQAKNTNPSHNVAMKLNDEKKKSDAYDFPMDLVGNTIQKGHAKPVSVPTSQFDRRNSAAIPMNKNASLNINNKNAQPSHMRMPSNTITAVNPYAGTQQNKPVSNQYVPLQNTSNAQNGFPPHPLTSGNQFQPPITQVPNSVVPPSAYAPLAATSQVHPAVVSGKYAPAQQLEPKLPSASINTNEPSTFKFPPGNNLPVKNVQQSAMPFQKMPILQARKMSVSRSGSDMYNPHQSKGSNRYAPAGKSQSGIYVDESVLSNQKQPHLPNSNLQQNPVYKAAVIPELNAYQPPSNLVSAIPSNHRPTLRYSNDPPLQAAENQALLTRQFPLFNWGPSRKIAYAIPSLITHNNYMMNSEINAITVNIVDMDEKVTKMNHLTSFIGPLVKGKTKEKDVSKWLNETIGFLSSEYDGDELLMYRLLDMKLSSETTFKDIASLFNSSINMTGIVPKTQAENHTELFSNKLSHQSQLRVFSYLQSGQHSEALKIALAEKDFGISVLIASISGKNNISEVIEQYFAQESIDSVNSNLFALLFHTLIGNPSFAVQTLYNYPSKGNWAVNNWQVIIFTLLNNIYPCEIDKSATSVGHIPLNVTEFIVDFALFLAQNQLILPSNILFSIVDMPLSSKPISPNSPIAFSYVGNAFAEHGIIWSEIYEFIYSKDPNHKYFRELLPQKLYHANILYEQGQIALATKYTDSLSATLNGLSKKDPIFINLNAHLHDLNNLMSSNSSWLGKPKFSSVWDQLDKSFNRYIGGDDDSSIQPSAEKNVFDRFTPVNSRVSSSLDLSQQTFTPYQNKLHPLTKVESVSVSEITRHGRTSPLKSNILMNENYLPHNPPEQLTHISPPNMINPLTGIHNNKMALQRANTEQVLNSKPVGIDQFYNQPPVKNASNYLPAEGLGHPPPLKSTPHMLPSEREAIEFTLTKNQDKSELLKPQLSRTISNENNSLQSTPSSSHLTTSDVKKAIATNRTETIDIIESDLIYPVTLRKENGSEIDSPSENKGLNEVQYATNNAYAPQTDTTEQLKPNYAANNLSNETLKLKQPLLPNADIPSPVTPLAGPPPLNSFKPSVSTATNNPKLKRVNSYVPVKTNIVPSTVEKPMIEENSYPNSELHSFGGYIPPPATGLNEERVGNMYEDNVENTPSTEKSLSRQDSGLNEIESQSAEFENEKKQYRLSSGVDQRNISGIEAIPQRIRSRFEPIKESEVLTKALFEPVIKVSNNLNFKPHSSRIQEEPTNEYDDVVEDESDDEDEQKRKELIAQNNARIQKEEEAQRKLDEKNQKQKESPNNNSQNNVDGSSGWFNWLKKDPNAKKPIKARLGNKKTNFYYDEELKRWVTKNATEEEKHQMSTPPPPPPIVKKKNVEPKTKPRSGNSFSISNNHDVSTPVGGVSPVTMTTSPSTEPNLQNSKPVTSPPGINLSGKKANGLDDLLTLGGSVPSNRRKKKPGRGYVNVLGKS